MVRMEWAWSLVMVERSLKSRLFNWKKDDQLYTYTRYMHIVQATPNVQATLYCFAASIRFVIFSRCLLFSFLYSSAHSFVWRYVGRIWIIVLPDIWNNIVFCFYIVFISHDFTKRTLCVHTTQQTMLIDSELLRFTLQVFTISG